jgi:hypothetical protein
MTNPKDSAALRLEAERDFNQECMFEAMDMEDEILLARGWDGKDSKDEKRLMELLGEDS